MQFTISLAGRKIGIRCSYEQTCSRCRDYLTEEEAELEFVITREDLEHERERTLRESGADGKKTTNVSDTELEALALYRKIAEALPEYATWLMHGSAVCVGDEAVLFAAESGVGKSTHTALWLEQMEPEHSRAAEGNLHAFQGYGEPNPGDSLSGGIPDASSADLPAGKNRCA